MSLNNELPAGDNSYGDSYDSTKPKPGRRGWVTGGAISLTASAVCVGLVGQACASAFEATADMNEAHNRAEITKIVWDKHNGIDPATAYFAEQLNSEGIKYHIESKPFFGHGPDLLKDPEVNKQLKGAGQEHFRVPFSAVKQKINKETGKVDFSVDMSKVTGSISWAGAGPRIDDYTIHDGKRNFGDRSGFTRQMDDLLGNLGGAVNIDKLKNILGDIDNSVEHDLRQRGLDAFKQCNDQAKFKRKLEGFIAKAVRDNVRQLGRGKDIGKVAVINDLKQVKIDTGQAAEDALGKDTYNNSYDLPSGEFNLELNCNAKGSGK